MLLEYKTSHIFLMKQNKKILYSIPPTVPLYLPQILQGTNSTPLTLIGHYPVLIPPKHGLSAMTWIRTYPLAILFELVTSRLDPCTCDW